MARSGNLSKWDFLHISNLIDNIMKLIFAVMWWCPLKTLTPTLLWRSRRNLIYSIIWIKCSWFVSLWQIIFKVLYKFAFWRIEYEKMIILSKIDYAFERNPHRNPKVSRSDAPHLLIIAMFKFRWCRERK